MWLHVPTSKNSSKFPEPMEVHGWGKKNEVFCQDAERCVCVGCPPHHFCGRKTTGELEKLWSLHLSCPGSVPYYPAWNVFS